MKRNYNQPDFYHFSEDSIFLARHAAKEFLDVKKVSVIDFCAGSGVVGIEFNLLSGNVNQQVFVELQEEFAEYIKENIERFTPETKTELIIKDFKDIVVIKEFDIAFANPPYFIDQDNRLPSNKNKKKCRFFKAGETEELVLKMKSSLNKEGQGYILGRRDQKELQLLVSKKMIFESVVLDDLVTVIYKLT